MVTGWLPSVLWRGGRREQSLPLFKAGLAVPPTGVYSSAPEPALAAQMLQGAWEGLL